MLYLLSIVLHRNAFGIHLPRVMEKRQAFPASDPLAEAGRLAL